VLRYCCVPFVESIKHSAAALNRVLNGIMDLPDNQKAIHDAVFGKLASVNPFLKYDFGPAKGLDISVPKDMWNPHYAAIFEDDTAEVERGPTTDITPEEVEKALAWQKNHAKITIKPTLGDKTETAFGTYRYVKCGEGGIGSGEVLGSDNKPFGISEEVSNFFPACMREGYEENGLPMGPQLTLEEMDKIYKATENIRALSPDAKLKRIVRFVRMGHFKLFMGNGTRETNFDIVIR